MADISQDLQKILDAIYGEEVRGSIYHAISLINDVSEKVIDAGTVVTGAASSSTGYYKDSLYINTSTYDLWKCIGTDSWTLLGNIKGAAGKGISSIAKTSTSGLVDTYTITYSDSTTITFSITNGNGIDSIAKTSTSGLIDTYTITYEDGTTTTFSVTNGKDGINGTNGTNGISVIGVTLVSKVGLVATYRMSFSDGSHFDYTVSDGAAGTGTGDMTKAVYDTDGDGIVDAAETIYGLTATIADLNKTANLKTVATSGSYNDLSNTPTIPAAVAVKGDAEATYRTGNVNLTKANIGLGNVGNFKAVSTVASQGLSDTEKSNARTNIGAGTSSFSGSYNDLSNKPTIPTVNNGQLTIQQNGTNKATFTANQSGNATANIITDTWTSTATVSSNGTVTFSGLNDSYGYKIYYTLPSGDSAYTCSKVSKSGSGTSVTLTYTTDAPSGTVCKLRILK
jgi:hypothetical protein